MPTFDEVVLHHLAVEGRPGPVKLLGGFAFIPVGREEGGKHSVSFVMGKIVHLLEPPAELFRQIHKGDLSSGQVHKDRLNEVLQLSYVARPLVAEHVGKRLLGKAFDLPPEPPVHVADVVITQRSQILLAVSERRQMDIGDAEAEKEIGSEFLFRHRPAPGSDWSRR